MYLINGKFYTEKITGMQRYAIEIIKELDKIAEPGEFQLLCPLNSKNIPKYKNIEVVCYGKKRGIIWEQLTMPIYMKKKRIRKSLNLLSIVPMINPHGLVVAHGVNYKVNPQFFKTIRDKLSRIWHLINYKWYFKRTEKIVTVSNFSKAEIIKAYNVPEERITVAPNAWQHMMEIKAAEDTFERFPYLTKQKYYYSLSSINDNKNFKWIINVANLNSDSQFAIAGGKSLVKYLDRIGINKPNNVFFLGYVSDEDNKTLMSNCKAFLFPTFYEGFGIPPMEAMACGAEAIVSDTPTMHEVYEDTVHYINPYKYNVKLDEIMKEKISPPNKIMNRYKWEESAKILYRVIRN